MHPNSRQTSKTTKQTDRQKCTSANRVIPSPPCTASTSIITPSTSEPHCTYHSPGGRSQHRRGEIRAAPLFLRSMVVVLLIKRSPCFFFHRSLLLLLLLLLLYLLLLLLLRLLTFIFLFFSWFSSFRFLCICFLFPVIFFTFFTSFLFLC